LGHKLLKNGGENRTGKKQWKNAKSTNTNAFCVVGVFLGLKVTHGFGEMPKRKKGATAEGSGGGERKKRE